jgi:RHS repeat-associated protein
VTDLRARLETVNDGPGPVFPRPIALFNYDLGNRVLNRSYRSGVVATYGYNPNNWITSLKHGKDAALIAGFGYDFDREGNKKFEQNLGRPAASQGYGYDADYRLVDFGVGQLSGATIPSPLTRTKWNLDPVGNWASKLTDGVTETRSHNAANEITNIQIGAGPIVAVTHENTGNLVNDGKSTYSYDEENRLIQATRLSTLAGDPRVVGQYRYDALGRRVRKLASPLGGVTETRYFHDGARIIEEQDAAKTTLATYTYGNYIDEVLAMNRAGQTFYYHQNSLWSVEAITDAAANVVERYAYDAYGLPTIRNGAGVVLSNSWGTAHSAVGNPWMFTGRQFDEETGLYYYRARYYEPGKGRFLQRDPRGYVDGLNLYQYVGGRPTFGTDPFGLVTCKPKLISGKMFYDQYKNGTLDKIDMEAWATPTDNLLTVRNYTWAIGYYVLWYREGSVDITTETEITCSVEDDNCQITSSTTGASDGVESKTSAVIVLKEQKNAKGDCIEIAAAASGALAPGSGPTVTAGKENVLSVSITWESAAQSRTMQLGTFKWCCQCESKSK